MNIFVELILKAFFQIHFLENYATYTVVGFNPTQPLAFSHCSSSGVLGLISPATPIILVR